MKAIIKFIQEARTELAKVSWPDRKTVINLTLTVIGVSLVFAVFIASVDYVFTEGIKLLTNFAPATSSSGITAEPIDLDVDNIEVETPEDNIQVETE